MFDEIVRLMKKHKNLFLKNLTYKDFSYNLLALKLIIKEELEEKK